MNRRHFLQGSFALSLGTPMLAALQQGKLEDAAAILARATATGEVASAVLHVGQREASFTRTFGKAQNEDAMFLLGSISKPIAVTALMTLFERGLFKLDDPLKKFLPRFTGGERERVTMQHLLTHVSGLPDQLPENNELRKKHAPLAEFIEGAIRTPLQFAPGSKYQYSSMAILLATHVAELLGGTDLPALIDRTVFQPLGMKHSAHGLGRFKLEEMVACQTDRAAPEAGGGDPSAKQWDWNSPYWRKLAAPWGGTHASAPDLARFLGEFLNERGAAIKVETARLMVRNHNPAGLTSRGLGFVVGAAAGSPGCSEKTFGHGGSTGTIAWADPATHTICIVLTSLPANAVHPHPRDLVSAVVAAPN
ncbi:MAG TPA: serine hydrolase domain-containing protein [Chthoniobacteraceae bacterium]|jgi:CubicO group peptidase (beta-lactamase class C family)|nr:serine hydrolase domain-containing protein [Chthoniobacteraceae bacterium]